MTASSAQLPPSQKLSLEDVKGMTQEVDRLKRLLESANDKCSVEFQIARTYVAGGQYREAMDGLQKLVDSNFGFYPSRDPIFAGLRSAKEFRALVNKVRSNTPPVSNSRAIATIPETDLFPENFAYDPVEKTFLIGSAIKSEVMRCRRGSPCESFASATRDGLGSVLGLKIHQPSKTLWVTSNTGQGASLRGYNIVSGTLIRNYPLFGAHLFNDLAVSSVGVVFVNDTNEGSVYKLAGGNNKLERLAPEHVFTAANGIALSPDQSRVFVASFGDGITIVDLASESAKPISHPADVCLTNIDGLYARKGTLIAIQNGPMVPRIARFTLNPDGGGIVAMKILEQRNPLFDGITTGTLLTDQFYYIANSQLDKIVDGKINPNVRLDPLQFWLSMLKVNEAINLNRWMV